MARVDASPVEGGSKGLVRGGEHRERSVARQRTDQSGGFDGGDQCAELIIAGGDVDNGLVTALLRLREPGNEKEGHQ